MDVKGLYDNIPPKEGVECVENGLEDSVNSKVPKEFIARLLEVVLEYSIFEFNQKLKQNYFIDYFIDYFHFHSLNLVTIIFFFSGGTPNCV